MRKILVLFFCLAPFGITYAQADSASVFDASILKNGNVWLYSREFYREDQVHAWPKTTTRTTGNIRFSLSGLANSGDTLKFRVVHEESLMTVVSLYSSGFDTTYTARRDTTWYAYRQNVFQPGTPLFADRNRFTPNGTKVVYHGDTVSYLLTPAPNMPVACGETPYSSENISGFGQIERYYSLKDCGNNATATWSSTDAYRLKALNGIAFVRDDVPVSRPTAVKLVAGRKRLLTPAFNKMGQGILFGKGSRLYDLKGRQAPAMPPALKAR